MNRQEIIDQALEALEFAEREAADQRKADDERRRADYYDSVQSFVERKLGLSGHIEVTWPTTPGLEATFKIADLGPFKKTHPDFIEGIKMPPDPDGTKYRKIDNLADLGDYLVWTGQAQREEVKP